MTTFICKGWRWWVSPPPYPMCHSRFMPKLSTATLNRIFSVWLYLMLLPSYHALISVSWQSVLDINMFLRSLLSLPFLWSMYFTGLKIRGMAPHLPAWWSLICWSRRHFFHILTYTKFKYVTSAYYHSWYLVFEITFDVTYYYRVIDI